MQAGRPRGAESHRRQRRLLAELAGGASLQAAAVTAHVSPETVLRLFGEQEFRTVAVALLDGRAPAVAVVAEPAIEEAA